MATMDPGQRGFGQQQRFNVPNLPFAGAAGAPPGGMPSMAPFADRMRQLLPQGQNYDELLQLLMAQLMAGQGGGARTAGPRRAMRGAQQGARGQQRPMGGGAPRQRPPMGGGRPPVVRMDDLVRALSGRGGGASQADLPVPQARR